MPRKPSEALVAARRLPYAIVGNDTDARSSAPMGIPAAGVRNWLRECRRRRLLRGGSAAMRAYRARRTAEIRAALAGGPARFLFIAGDSHAEFIGDRAAPDRAVVNGGIGGITASVYAAGLQDLAFDGRAAAAMIFIGSNDITCKRAPLSRGSRDRFGQSVSLIAALAHERAEAVWIAAIPPVRPNTAYPQVVEAVPSYNRLLMQVAAAGGCAYVDPFAHMRDGDGGLAVDGSLRDGVHLTDYGPIAEEVTSTLRRAAGMG